MDRHICHICGAVLTLDEYMYYEITCEKCEKKITDRIINV